MGHQGRTWDDVIERLEEVRPLALASDVPVILDEWIGDRKWDVIHWNFGLHDLKYMGPNNENLADPEADDSHQQVPVEQYTENLRKIGKRLKETGA